MIRTNDTDGTTWSSDLLRVQAWRETLAAADLEAADELLVTETYGVEAGARAMARLLTCPSRRRRSSPTPTSWPSLPSPTPARRARAPEDLSVVGVDGHPLGEQVASPPWTRTSPARAGWPASLTVRLLSGEQVSDIDVPVRLVQRQSSGLAPAPA